MMKTAVNLNHFSLVNQSTPLSYSGGFGGGEESGHAPLPFPNIAMPPSSRTVCHKRQSCTVCHALKCRENASESVQIFTWSAHGVCQFCAHVGTSPPPVPISDGLEWSSGHPPLPNPRSALVPQQSPFSP